MTGPQSAPPRSPPPAAAPPTAAPPPPAAPQTSAPAAAMPSFLSKLSRPEQFIAGGAGLIVLTQLIFVLFGPYGFADIGWAAAVVALLVIFFNGVSAGSMRFSRETYTSLLVLLGAFMAILGVRELIDDVLFISSSRIDPVYYLGALGFYAGVVLMAIGASQLWGQRAR